MMSACQVIVIDSIEYTLVSIFYLLFTFIFIGLLNRDKGSAIFSFVPTRQYMLTIWNDGLN